MVVIRELFAKYSLTNIRLNAGMVQADIAPNSADKDAAWEMYVEMLTRIVTQPAGIHMEGNDKIPTLIQAAAKSAYWPFYFICMVHISTRYIKAMSLPNDVLESILHWDSLPDNHKIKLET